MRSHTDARVRTVAMSSLVTAALLFVGALIQLPPVLAQEEGPGPDEIARALDVVKADPNLATERTIKMLRWRRSADDRRSGTPAWLAWLGGLFLWLEQTARILVWCAAVILAGMIVVYLLRIVRARGVSRPEASFVTPTHVQDLDIRPETLPSDIGGTARALWNRGDHRASLALLYRGMLSRLVHMHGVPIRDSSTEGECLALSASHLAQRGHQYATRLVRVWQRAVYGREAVQAQIVYVLCDDFGPSLDPAAPFHSTVADVSHDTQ